MKYELVSDILWISMDIWYCRQEMLAIDIAKKESFSLDLTLMDIQPPGMDYGLQATSISEKRCG